MISVTVMCSAYCSNEKEEKENHLSKILCPFCSKPWNEKMMDLYEEANGYETYGGTTYEAKLTITCDGCERIIYEK